MISDPAKRFPGYEVLAQLGETHYSSVYRARKSDHGDTVIIKVMRGKNPSPDQITRFKHEYELIRGIEIDGVIKPVDFMICDGMPAMVMEDFGGRTLKEVIGDGLALERFLQLAIRLAEILGALHRENIFHRDIKPSNILLNPDSDLLKITDFGIAEMIPVDEEIANPHVIEGTLAYISPEQTGRMNCGVDYRTDLYSLGVTFYEMVTGTVPFTSSDPLEIIHAHMALMPLPLQELKPEIPVPVSDIIMKLLAKSAARRYQNSLGLAADLKACLQQWQMTGGIEPFKLGTKDISLRFIIPQTLMGRDEELERLYGAFDRISHGSAEMVLVSGDPGIGKSALINEIHKPIVGRHGYFAAGKFDQFLKSVPYSAIIQAFQSLTRQLLAESDAQLNRRREQLLAALGPNGKIITDVIPDIEFIIGKQPEVPEQGPEETRNRFNLVFKKFVHTFADEHHPLVVFLDDLQWADSASLNLIQTLLTDRSLSYQLFVGAYRDTETELAGHHPLMLTLEAIRAAGIKMQTIHLGALDVAAVKDLIGSIAGCDADTAQTLARVVYEKTQGSPFFIHQFLKTLYDRQLIRLDTDRGWIWDLSGIQVLPATDNVVTFMAERLNELPPADLAILKTCACLGDHFDLQTLLAITRRPANEILPVINALLQEELIVRTGDLHRFYHDRIKEAAYCLLSDQEREQLHYRIGRLYLERTPEKELFNRLFYICDQLNQALSCLADQEERIRLAELNLKAGVKAKESTAYGAAVQYLSVGSTLLPENSWKIHYELTFALFIELMECRYLDRNFEEAERLFSVVLSNAATTVDKAKAYDIMIVLYTNLRNPEDAIALGLKGLALFDIHLSLRTGKAAVVWEWLQLKRKLDKLGVERLLDLPMIDDERTAACLDLIFKIGTPTYYTNQNLFAKLVLKGVNVALTYDSISPNAPGGTMAVATIVQTGFGNYELGHRLAEVALALNDRLVYRKTAGMVYHIFAFFMQHWKRHARNSLDIYRKAYQLSLEVGNFIYAGHSVNAATDCRIMIGVRLDEILAENEKYEGLMDIVKDPFITACHRQNHQLILNLTGRTDNRYSLSGPGFDHDAHMEQLRREMNYFGLCIALLYKLKVHYLYGNITEALNAAAELDQYIKVQMGTQLMAEHFFYYTLVLTALILDRKKKRFNYRRIIRRNQRKMRKWAELCPENFRHKYDLLTAEMMAVKGRFQQAQSLYHAAVEGAGQNEYLHEEALACERLALFYRSGGGMEAARMIMQQAYQCYDRWGAAAKLEDLKERYRDLLSPDHPTGPTDKHNTLTLASAAYRNLDFSTVMQVSQVISSEIMLDRLLGKIMHISIANAGAQRGYLILASDGQLRVQASEDVVSGEKQILQDLSLDACKGLSPAIVNYVHHSGEPVILGNAAGSGNFINDPHVRKYGCKSVLSLPILNKGQRMGILYMENNLTADIFTPERLEILRVISAQAAIALQNAELYKEISAEITIRKQAEAAMRASEDKYRSMLEEMQDIYCETDLNGVITFINPATCAISGYSQSELMGVDFKKGLPPPAKKELARYFHEIEVTGQPGKPTSCDLIAKNGAMISLEIAASPIWNKKGRVVGFRSVGRDVSERKRLEEDLLDSFKNVQTARMATILGLAKLAEYRDEETGSHLERMREYARIITKELALMPQYREYITAEYIDDIYNSAILHDIGKVGVPDAILLKPGKLTAEEFEIIKTHATLGGDALRAIEAKIPGQTFLTLGKEIAYYHHEKWNGAGYPKGLKGEEIPLSARIVALADVYDALTSKRAYKDAFSHRKAMDIIVKDRGTHFAPDVVDAFLIHADAFRRIKEELHAE